MSSTVYETYYFYLVAYSLVFITIVFLLFFTVAKRPKPVRVTPNKTGTPRRRKAKKRRRRKRERSKEWVPTTNYGPELKKYRLKLGLSLREVDRATGISSGNISRIENKRIKKMRESDFYLLFKFYDTEASERKYP